MPVSWGPRSLVAASEGHFTNRQAEAERDDSAGPERTAEEGHAVGPAALSWKEAAARRVGGRGPGRHLQLPDVLALLGHLAHRLAHEGDQHVEQQHEGEDDVGDQEDDEDHGVLGAAEHLQVAHADGQLEEVQQESAERLAVAARGVRGHGAVGVVLAAHLHVGTWVQKGHQGCGGAG